MRKDGPIEAKHEVTEEMNGFLAYFRELWKEGKPLGKLFRTASHGYLYDSGTNKLLKCEDHVFYFLNNYFIGDTDRFVQEYLERYGRERFLDAAVQIKGAIESELVLSANNVTQFGLSAHYDGLEKLLDTDLGILTLEVTEHCNLRCGYCVYNPHVEFSREHGSREMSLDVAYRAIDYLNQHSSAKESVAVTFYGGEPLLRFPFIKSCVDYAQSVIKDRRVTFNLTTNAVLLTDEVIEFFLKNDFALTVSLDGPREVHDQYRKDLHGNGSYDRVTANLKKLIEAYDKKAVEKIQLSMVYTPPFSGKKIDRIAALWEELPWLPKNIGASLSYPLADSIPMEDLTGGSENEDKTVGEWAAEKYGESYDGKEQNNPLGKNSMERGLAQFAQRPIFTRRIDQYFLNGCCIPGARKLYVAVDGSFRVCERVAGAAPAIGDVFNGFDMDVIKKVYVDEYERVSLPACSKCWAIRFCHVCYALAANNKGKFDLGYKERGCWGDRLAKLNILKLFCSLMEKDPDGLKFLYDIKLE